MSLAFNDKKANAVFGYTLRINFPVSSTQIPDDGLLTFDSEQT